MRRTVPFFKKGRTVQKFSVSATVAPRTDAGVRIPLFCHGNLVADFKPPGSAGQSMKCVLIWLAVSRAQQGRPHYIRGPAGGHA
jgi:hypothetical protein